MAPLEKRRKLKLLILVFSKPEKEKFISSKKGFFDFKDSIDQKENIIEYVSEVD